MTKILSISIAAYNIEKYIHNLLDSFLVNEILSKLEVIIVNDGSRDRTSKIAKEYQKKYPDTFILIDKENGGYGSTINTAVKIASGKYFKTIDGDDWVDSDGLCKLIKYLCITDDDIVVTNFSRVSDKTNKKIDTIFKCSKYDETFLIDDIYDGQHLFMQALTFKTEILKKLNLQITNHCFYTDIEYILTPLPYCNTISFFNEFVYMYRISVNEQSMSINGKRKHIDEQLFILKKMISYFNENKYRLGQGRKSYFIVILSEMFKSHITAILSLKISKHSFSRLLELDKYVEENSKEIFYNTNNYRTVFWLRKTKYLFYLPGSISYRIYQKILSYMER